MINPCQVSSERPFFIRAGTLRTALDHLSASRHRLVSSDAELQADQSEAASLGILAVVLVPKRTLIHRSVLSHRLVVSFVGSLGLVRTVRDLMASARDMVYILRALRLSLRHIALLVFYTAQLASDCPVPLVSLSSLGGLMVSARV